jgi:hypothetical protein
METDIIQLEKMIEFELRDAYKESSFETLWCLYKKFGQNTNILTYDAYRFCVIRRMLIEIYPTLYYDRIRGNKI